MQVNPLSRSIAVVDELGRPTQELNLFSEAVSRLLSISTVNNLNDLSALSPTLGSVISTKGAIVAGEGAGVFDVVPASGTPDGRGRVLLANGLHAVLRPPYNIEQFGCRITDSDISNDLQLAFTFCEGHALEIPIGTYTRAKSLDSPTMRNIVLWGHGDSSHIFFNDVSSISRRDFIDSSNSDFIYLHNFKVSGTALSELNTINASQCFKGTNIGRVVIDRVTFDGLRFMATAYTRVKSALVTNCVLKHVMRDGIRFVESRNVIVDNNTLSNVADDCIAVHSEDSAGLVDASNLIQITNNTMTACQCVKVLGAKNAIITNNVFNFCLRSAIRLTPQLTDTTEGNTPQLNIVIANNVILDTFGDRGTDNVIYLGSNRGREFAGISPKPMIAAVPYAYNYTNNVDAAGVVNIGSHRIQITNNIIARTRPSGVSYSTFGFGQLFDGITPGFLSDPVLTEANFAVTDIHIEAPISDVLIQGNQLSSGIGKYPVLLDVNGSSNVQDISNFSILGNHFVDCPSGAIFLTGSSSGAGAAALNVFKNVFDCDPYFRNSGHNSDNTWAAENSCVALQVSISNTTVAGGNTFKNCSWTGLDALRYVNAGKNIIYSEAVAHGDNAGNKGVRHLPAAHDNIILSINGDPTSSTYGQVLNTVLTISATMPTTGKYVYGHLVSNSDQNVLGSAGSRYIVTGWKRLTTGSAHVLDTDWSELRSLTGT